MSDLINQLPNELLENIFLKISYSNKLELVCKKWNTINSNPIIKKLRLPCICLEGPHHGLSCIGLEHPCICLGGPHHALSCNGLEHPCICLGGPHHALRCKAIHDN